MRTSKSAVFVKLFLKSSKFKHLSSKFQIVKAHGKKYTAELTKRRRFGIARNSCLFRYLFSGEEKYKVSAFSIHQSSLVS